MLTIFLSDVSETQVVKETGRTGFFLLGCCRRANI